MHAKYFVAISALSYGLVSGAKLQENLQSSRNGRQNGKWPTLSGEPIVFMGHRGEKVFMPEHTVASYELGAIEGAEYVEPDLVLTKDGHLVCFHDLTLKTGTNVAQLPEYADKMVNFTGVIDEDGDNVTIRNDWFINNFTLAELKVLKVVQKNIGIRPQWFNDQFSIPTFEEYLEIVHHTAYRLNKSVGVIPELKHPMFHNSYFENTPNYMEELVLSTLTKWGYALNNGNVDNCTSPMDKDEQGIAAPISCGHLIIQSFELSCIKYLASKTSVDKMMLIDVQLPLLTIKGLLDVSRYATYYALWKEHLYTGIEAKLEADGIPYDKELIAEMGGFIPPRDIVSEAHELGLKVGIYTIYDSREPSNRGCDIGKCDPQNKEVELFFYFEMGVDGMFVENVGEARELRSKYQYRVIDEDQGKSSSTTCAMSYGTTLSFVLITLISQYLN